MASTASEAAEKAVADPEIGLLHEDDTATASTNQSAIAQAQAKYPRILALRDQKGSGECLEYRKIENSLQVHVRMFIIVEYLGLALILSSRPSRPKACRPLFVTHSLARKASVLG